MKMKIYLCGPIHMISHHEAKEWRSIAKKRLSDKFELLDPMRRNFRDSELLSANEIVQFCLQDIKDADIILVNYSKASIGTSMEIREAYQQGKFIIAFTPRDEPGFEISPWMLYHCTRIVKGFDTALKYLLFHFVELKPKRSVLKRMLK